MSSNLTPSMFNQGAAVDTRGFGQAPLGGLGIIPFITTRSPTTSDIRGPYGLWVLGQRWVNSSAGAEYVLTGLTVSTSALVSATWVLLGSDSGALNTLTGDDDVAVTPSAGNISLNGTSGQIVTSSGGDSNIVFALSDTLVAPGSLEVTGLLQGDAGATLNTAGTAINVATDSDTSAVNIATSSNARTLTLGNVTSTSGTVIKVGTGNFLLEGAATSTYTIGTNTTSGSITVGASGMTGTITLGNSTSGQDINIGTASAAQLIAIGSSSGASSLTLAFGSGNCSIAGAVAGTITIGASAQTGLITLGSSSTTSEVDIASGAGASTVKIAGGTGGNTVQIAHGAGTNSVNIGDGASVNTITIGSATSTSALSLLFGSGNCSIAGAVGATITIGASAQTGTITIGSSSSTAAVTIAGSTGVQTISIGTGGTGVKTINIGTGAVANPVTVGSTTTGATLFLQSGATSTGGVSYAGSLFATVGAIATTATDGFLYVATCAGTPTGTPTSRGAAGAGSAPIVFDTSGVKIWVYTGGAWKGVAVA